MIFGVGQLTRTGALAVVALELAVAHHFHDVGQLLAAALHLEHFTQFGGQLSVRQAGADQQDDEHGQQSDGEHIADEDAS